MIARAAIVLAVFAPVVLAPGRAAAAVPPLELAQKSLAQQRTGKQVTYDLRVTQMSTPLHEFTLRGTFTYGARPEALPPERSFDLRLVWIALLAEDPVAELQRAADGFIDARAATIGVQEEFVVVYGASPSFSVSRDLARITAMAVRHGEHRWAVRLTWRDGRVTGAMVTRDGQTVLTARANQP